MSIFRRHIIIIIIVVVVVVVIIVIIIIIIIIVIIVIIIAAVLVLQEKFVERVIAQMMELLSPARLDSLAPGEAVMLYQQFSIVSSFLDYSPRVTNFIRSNYEEEFKYGTPLHSVTTLV